MSNYNVYDKIISKTGQIAVLIDPEKISNYIKLKELLLKIEKSNIDFIFIGGSTCSKIQFYNVTKFVKENSKLTTIIFPGSNNQISEHADGILYLSLISGRNPTYLIGQHVESALQLSNINIEIIPTGYILIDGHSQTSVVNISQTKAIKSNDIDLALKTSLAGQHLGKKIIYFDAGSGAKKPVKNKLIREIKNHVKIPIIVGGGIKTTKKIIKLKKLGVNIIVVGNIIEENINFLNEINKLSK